MAKCDGIRASNVAAAKREEAMRDEPKVIAEAAVFRLLSDGVTQRLSALRYGTRPEEWEDCDSDEVVVADLLADAVRRIEQDFEERLEEIVVAAYGRMEALERRVAELVDSWHPGYPDEKPLAYRVAALEHEVGVAKAEWGDVLGRLDALEARQENEEGPRIHAELRRRIGELADRMAAVERLTADTRTHQEELAIVCEQDIRSIGGRVGTLEARQEDEAGERSLRALAEDVVEKIRRWNHGVIDSADLLDYADNVEDEYVKRDEAEEETPEHFDMPGPSRAEQRYCLTDTAIETLRSNERYELAREIVDWLRETYSDSSTEKGAHAAGVVLGAARRIEQEYCK